MNKFITSSIFMAAGLSALNVSAQSNQTQLAGSDTLFDITQTVLAGCPGATGLSYVGTGSSNGEKALVKGATTTLQNWAPMSRFFNGNSGSAAAGNFAMGAVCNPAGATTTDPSGAAVAFNQTTVEQNAEGVVCGLDGISIYGSVKSGAKSSCNGPALTTTISWNPGTFLSYNGTCSTSETRSYNGGNYTFSDWTDVLRIVYAGTDHCGVKDCGSDLRAGLVQNWGKLFQNGEASTENCDTTTDGNGTCTQLRHAFRRDNYSGTTDTFLALLGLPSVGRQANNMVKSDPFCNSVQGANAAALPAGVNDYQPDYRNRDPIQRCAAGNNNPSKSGAIPTNVATEQLASRNGKLGLVLAINPMSDVIPKGQAVPYPITNCTATAIFGTAPPAAFNATTSVDTGTGRCPNGDTAVLGNQCLVPADSTGNANCLPSAGAKPGFVFDSGTVEGIGHGAADGRVYGTIVYLTSAGAAGLISDVNNHKVTGAYSRLHSTRTMNLPDTSVLPCQVPDATGNIACLTQADRCSIGFAGRGAETQILDGSGQVTVNPMPLLNKLPTDANLLSLAYPLVRKLYLNTAIPTANIWGQEAAYETCYLSPTTTGPVGCQAAMTASGFLAITPFCEDFNETAMCPGAGANVNNCATNYPTLTATTVCGDGITDTYEDCDNGSSNGGCPNTCSKTCRFNVCKPSSCP